MKGMGIVLGVALASVSATAATETVNGLTWTYSISGNAAVIGGSAGPAVPEGTVGCIEIPRSLGGRPVAEVRHGAFVFGDANLNAETTLVFPDTVKKMSSFACHGGEISSGGVDPYYVHYFRPMSDFDVNVLFAGAAPTVVDDSESGDDLYRFLLESDDGRVSAHAMFYGIAVRVVKGSSGWAVYANYGFEGGPVMEDCALAKFSPASGTSFDDSLKVSISCNASEAAIYYTIDGSIPEEPAVVTNESGEVTVYGENTLTYRGPFTIYDSCTVRAIAVVPEYSSVLETSADYTCRVKTVSTPVISPDGGNFSNSTVPVTLSCDFADADIFYTVDGSEPTTNSTMYSGAFSVGSGLLQGETVTVKAIAWKEKCKVSGVAAATFTRCVSYAEAVGLSDPATGETEEGISLAESSLSGGSWSIVQDAEPGTYYISTSGADAGESADLSLAVSCPGTLKFQWRLCCHDENENPGSSFATCMTDEFVGKYLKNDNPGDQSEDWSEEQELTFVEDDFDASGRIVVRFSFISKDFDGNLVKDELNLRNFKWEPEQDNGGQQ